MKPPRDLVSRKEADADVTRTAARWKALRTGYWGMWNAQPSWAGGYTLSIAEELRKLRTGPRRDA